MSVSHRPLPSDHTITRKAVYEEMPSSSGSVRSSGVRRDVKLPRGGDDDNDNDTIADSQESFYEEMPSVDHTTHRFLTALWVRTVLFVAYTS